MSHEPGQHGSLLETLAAGVAHEVRNPLNSIQINLKILEQELMETLPRRPARVFSVLSKIGVEIKRLDDFVAEFLRFARAPELKLEHLEVRPLLADLVAFLSPECSQKDVALGLELLGPERAWLDGFQLKQAVLNLVLNALQASSAGDHVVIRTGGEGGRFEISVRDDGEGMPAEVRARAFEPFFTTREGGTGLGLPLVRRVVDRHGGSVELESEAGRGTVVTLVFPGRDAG
jgi:signal transduction histidine kinase